MHSLVWRCLGIVCLSVLLTLPAAAWSENGSDDSPFDTALLDGPVPTDIQESRVIIAELRLRGRPESAQALEAWLTRRDAGKLFGNTLAAASVREAIADHASHGRALQRTMLEQFEKAFAVDFLQSTPVAEIKGPANGVASQVVPGVIEWKENDAHSTPLRFDVLVGISNNTERPVKISFAWFVPGAMFSCDEAYVEPGHSTSATCTTHSAISDAGRVVDVLTALKQGRSGATITTRDVTSPSLGVSLRASMTSVTLAGSDDARLGQVTMLEARRRLSEAPCEAIGDCADRQQRGSEPRSVGYGKLLLWILAFAIILGVRAWRSVPLPRSIIIGWSIYSVAGVIAIMLTLIDPPQAGSSDGMVHGAVGQLLLFGLGAPWSLIIANSPGSAPVTGFLILAVVVNVAYGLAYVCLGRRDRLS